MAGSFLIRTTVAAAAMAIGALVPVHAKPKVVILGFDGADDELVLSAGFIDGDIALQQHLLPVLEQVPRGAGLVAEAHALKLGAGVLE